MTEAITTPPGTDPVPTRSRRQRVILTLSIVGGVLLALIAVAFLVGATTFKSFSIPSGSMEPTLQPGDRLLVRRDADRGTDVGRGDIVVFSRPAGDTSPIQARVSRVIGLPGETLTIDDGHVAIDGHVLDEPYLAPGTVTESVGSHGCEPATPCVVPDGQVFVLSDNRGNAIDSRFTGPILQSTIVGRADYRAWPLSRLHAL